MDDAMARACHALAAEGRVWQLVREQREQRPGVRC
jgi:hypothetical protein